MNSIVILGRIHSMSRFQFLQMFQKQLPFIRIGMVEIVATSIHFGQVIQVEVIPVLAENQNLSILESFMQEIHKGGFPRASSPGYADHQYRTFHALP